MTIKGMTDRGLAFPEIGQIRKGGKKIDPKRPGPDLKYFRVEFDERETEAAETFLSVYGAEPTEIRVILPFNEIERMWDAWLEAYTAGRMVARSDGEIFVYLLDTQTGEIRVKGGIDIKTGLPMPYVEGQIVGMDYEGKPVKCKPCGRLKVIVRELARAAYLTVMTTSVHDIVNISNQIAAFKALNNDQIAGIPLVLRRRPKKISVPMQGKRVRAEKWLLSIEADPEWVKAKLGEVQRAALPEGIATPLLPDAENVIDAPAAWVDEDDEITDLNELDEQNPYGADEDPESDPLAAFDPAAIEAAKSMTHKDGRRYADISPDELANMLGQCENALAENHMTESARASVTAKRDALHLLLSYHDALKVYNGA